MYRYNEVDKQIVQERVDQFRDQVERRLNGELTEAEFLPLRLQNGLYLQRHAYMLRVAIPYGLLSSDQLRCLGRIARDFDRGYGHVSTRQNMQYNWPKLAETADILQELANVEMHAIQTSGNCVRNISADPLAGVAEDEIEDPRPYCEITRQWSTFHPEFAHLPRKFKLAFTGATTDRAAVAYHDIGVRMVRNDEGEVGFAILAGGGMGRTPVVGPTIRDFLPKKDLLSYIEAILRVYNLFGNRKNKYRARIKILVRSLGAEEFTRRVEEEFSKIQGQLELPMDEIERVKAFFVPHDYEASANDDQSHLAHAAKNPAFARWLTRNVSPHKVAGYNVAWISLKAKDLPPGDITDEQMFAVADLADTFSFGEVRTHHDQNMLFGDVKNADLFALWGQLEALKLATPNIGTLTDMICCPGLDFCALANAGSINVAKQITDRFEDLDYLYDLGEVQLKMSGCINSCGHHHVGHIGILGVNKSGMEYYQILLGGSPSDDASIGKFVGPAIPQSDITQAIERLLETYVSEREGEERFLDTYRRIGPKPFKENVYAAR